MAKKKYAQNFKDREDEHEAMERKYEKRSMGSRGFVTGNDPSIGRNDVAGLPKECVQEMYPKSPQWPGDYINDSISGIDQVQKEGEGMRKRYISNQK